MAFPVDPTRTYQDDGIGYDWLDYPFETTEEQWINVQGRYTVSQLSNGMIGVRLKQVSEKLLSGSSIAVVPAGGGTPLVQSSQAVRPSAGQYRPDWQKFTGQVEFNASQIGDEFVIKYVSSGTAVTLANLDSAFVELIGRSTSRTFGGDVNISGLLSVVGNGIFGGTLTSGAEKSLTTPGYIRLTNGLLVHYGLGVTITAGGAKVTWSPAFEKILMAHFVAGTNSQFTPPYSYAGNQDGFITLNMDYYVDGMQLITYTSHILISPYHISNTSGSLGVNYIVIGI